MPRKSKEKLQKVNANGKQEQDLHLGRIEATKKILLEKIKDDNVFNFEMACKATGISIATGYNYRNADPEYNQAICKAMAEGKVRMIGFAETALVKKVASGDTTAIIFTLKTIGKERGYVERHDLHHTGSIGHHADDDLKILERFRDEIKAEIRKELTDA